MTAALVRLLRIASIVICLIVAASFLVFAVQQTKTASGHQQASLASPTGTTVSSGEPSTRNEGTIHKALDETSAELTSPFAGIVTGSSEWATRGIRLLAALVVYGFGLGYLARVLRVRV